MKKPWHLLELSEVFAETESSTQGISSDSIPERIKKFGKNILPEEKPLSVIYLFFSQFHNPLIYILLAAFGVSLYLDHFSDAIFIIIVLLINTTVGFYQEYKADRSIAALKKVVNISARVIRDGNLREINSTDLVKGDVFLIKAGDKIPADACIIESKNLKVNEASLTGEWIAEEKKEGTLEADTPLGDRTNMLFMGTLVEEGTGKAVIVETGVYTVVGDIVSLIRETSERKTPLQKKLSKLSKIAGAFVMIIIALVTVIGIFRGQSFSEIFIASLALAVSAVPAGLLPAITVILVLGMNRILKQRGLVRKLVANETLGSVTVICTDKTGTLTEGKMQVSHILASEDELFADSFGISPIEAKEAETHIMTLKAALLTSEAFIENPDDELDKWIVRGRSTEQALLLAAANAGLEQRALNEEYTVLEEIPFDSSNKYAVSVRSTNEDERFLYVTGAPEIILNKSSRFECNKQIILDEEKNKTLIGKLDNLATKGLRVVACAYRKIDEVDNLDDLNKLLNNLTFLGFIALRDPLRKETKQSIAETEKAGIRTVIITGDHQYTALAVATEIGLRASPGTILTGREIEEIDEDQLKEKAKTVNIYARVSPNHKLKIIQALQAEKQVVAMIGDGVNDAPALKAADVGVTVGSGTDVAKEVADIVLLDSNFKTIVKAVEQGRVVFENIKKVFVYLLIDDFSEIFIFLVAMILGLPIPLVAAQILWINLVEDGLPDIALTTEQETEGVMNEKPRDPKESILSKPMRKWMTVIFFVAGLSAFLLFFFTLKITGSVEKARVMAFTLMCLDSMFFALSVRSFKRPLWRKDILSNKILDGAILIGILLLLSAIYLPPLQKLLSTSPLVLFEWFIIVILVIMEITFIEIAKKLSFRVKTV
ncbi:MAG: HAD-IC family P-type ATPase [Candidatus Zambryskibacteria bacterium]|nr:HAD-IC family P-type ATPase [Candidatus Zambryskibacteria bacterium]